VLRPDNVGAMFMARNSSSGVRIRHIDTRYHYMREYVEDGFIKIVIFNKEDNNSDLFTKNFNKDTYERHVMKFLGKIDGWIDMIGRVLKYDPYIQPLWLMIL
jgi:hypothetical protein